MIKKWLVEVPGLKQWSCQALGEYKFHYLLLENKPGLSRPAKENASVDRGSSSLTCSVKVWQISFSCSQEERPDVKAAEALEITAVMA